MGFLESVFSFVFGDGDPNRGLEEKKWKAVAGAIRANDGAVTAEQLAPFLASEDRERETTFNVDESFVVPALLRFKGHPEVTDDGDIIYVFPEMTKSGSNVDVVSDPRGRFIEEEMWQFSDASSEQKVFAGFLGAVNFFGVFTLGNILATPSAIRNAPPGFLAGIQGLFPLLLAYALSFAVVPVARWAWIRRKNAVIAIGNRVRRAAATVSKHKRLPHRPRNPTRHCLRGNAYKMC